jgi:hypothetical protein
MGKCRNEVSFHGDTAAAVKAYTAFSDLAEGKLQLPAIKEIGPDDFSDLRLKDGQRFSYYTDEGPNLKLITAYAAYFGADHRHYYINPSWALCGEMVSQNGIANHTQLVPSDFDLINYDAACEQFEFRHGSADDPYELWPIILEEKQKAMHKNDVRRRLSGELPHILLGPDDYVIDLANRAFFKSDERKHWISMHNMVLNEDESGYVMYYYLPAQQAVPPPRDLRECPDNIWILEIPREWELDPIGCARENQGLDSDYLLRYPYQAYRCATAYSAAEYLELQKGKSRGR